MTAARPIVVKNIAEAGLKSKWTRRKLRVTWVEDILGVKAGFERGWGTGHVLADTGDSRERAWDHKMIKVIKDSLVWDGAQQDGVQVAVGGQEVQCGVQHALVGGGAVDHQKKEYFNKL